ncbi:MAG: LamG domain-containing protein, partial [Chloroflexota bacterium]
SSVYEIIVDVKPPTVGINNSGDTITALTDPTQDLTWSMSLNGTVSDPQVAGEAGSGVDPDSLMISLINSAGDTLDGHAQLATLNGNAWEISYVSSGSAPSGIYTVMVRVADEVGNGTETAVGTIWIDAQAAHADADYWLLPSGVISDSLTLSGKVLEQPAWGDVLARYHFEEAPGSTFYDNHVEEEHATCTNCPTQTAALFGQGLQFDGVDDSVDVPNLFDPSVDTFTLALWIYVDAAGTGQRLLVQQADGSGQGSALLFLDAANTLQSNLLGGVAGTTAVTTNEWHHVAFVFDGTTGRIYLDGQLDGSNILTPEVADGNLQLGSDSHTSAFFHGLMDEFVVYGAALDDYAIYNLAQDSGYGVDTVEVGYEPVDFASLDGGTALRTAVSGNTTIWYDAIIDNPGDLFSTWSLADNIALENYYTVKLRSSDQGDNESSVGTIWRGLIDRVPPTVTASGEQVWNGGVQETEYTYTFSDFLLDGNSFIQPCGEADITLSTYDDATLPHDGLPYALTATCRVAGWEASRDITACDSVGHCTTVTVEPDTSSCSPPTAVSDVAVAPNGVQVALSWTHHANNSDYQVYRSTSPYFDPTDAGVVQLTGSIVYGGGMASIDDTGAILGNPAVNFYYYVVGVNGCGAETAVSNHTGAFDFSIVPGTP